MRSAWTMRLICVFLLVVGLLADDPVDDFSEFDQAETFETVAPAAAPTTTPKPDPVVFVEEEFAPIEEDEFEQREQEVNKEPVERKINPLTFADIPAHFRSNWSSYQVEAVMLFLIFLYALNFAMGRSKNHSLASEWYQQSHAILQQQFALVGDDGTSQDPTGGNLVKETECTYSVWCSGRVGVQGMLSQLKLVKRQDLVGMVMNSVSPKKDRVVHKVDLDMGEIDSFVFIVGVRKSVTKLIKEYPDLTNFTAEKKSQVPLPSNFVVFAEISETIPAIVDQSVQQFMKRYENVLEYLHISDQYCGAKSTEESVARLPECNPTMIFSYHLTDVESKANLEQVILQFTFHTIDRIRRYRLSREGKQKADKKRRSVEEAFLKNTHQQRQEAAQARREEKSRELKQRLLEEEDPEKQKKLQKLEDKKSNKLKMPKMKQLRAK